MPKETKQEQELKAVKARVKDPLIQKSIEEKQKYLNRPISK